MDEWIDEWMNDEHDDVFVGEQLKDGDPLLGGSDIGNDGGNGGDGQIKCEREYVKK